MEAMRLRSTLFLDNAAPVAPACSHSEEYFATRNQ
jgi:hypothetical protein